jgi:hypothetical protein
VRQADITLFDRPGFYGPGLAVRRGDRAWGVCNAAIETMPERYDPALLSRH